MRLFKLWSPVFAWAGFIFYLSSIPYLETGLPYDFLLRKIAHISEYFILTLFLYRAFKNTFTLKPLRLFVYPATTAVLYAVSDETHQLFVPGRGGSPRDVFIDAIGIFGFYLVVRAFRRSTVKSRI